MFCSNCGQQIPDTSKFCKYCGTPMEPITPPAAKPVQPAPQPVRPVQPQPVRPVQPIQPAPRPVVNSAATTQKKKLGGFAHFVIALLSFLIFFGIGSQIGSCATSCNGPTGESGISSFTKEINGGTETLRLTYENDKITVYRDIFTMSVNGLSDSDIINLKAGLRAAMFPVMSLDFCLTDVSVDDSTQTLSATVTISELDISENVKALARTGFVDGITAEADYISFEETKKNLLSGGWTLEY